MMANLLLDKCNYNIYRLNNGKFCWVSVIPKPMTVSAKGPLVGNLKNEIIKFYDKPKYG